MNAPPLRPRSRMRGPVSLAISLKRLRGISDRAAYYRRDMSRDERAWCLRVADVCEELVTRWEDIHRCR